MAANEAAKEDIFVDSEGNRVNGDDPKAAFKIASKGVVPDAKMAARYKDAFAASTPKTASAKKTAAADDDSDATKSDAKARASKSATK